MYVILYKGCLGGTERPATRFLASRDSLSLSKGVKERVPRDAAAPISERMHTPDFGNASRVNRSRARTAVKRPALLLLSNARRYRVQPELSEAVAASCAVE